MHFGNDVGIPLCPSFIKQTYYASDDNPSVCNKPETKSSMRITKKYEHLVYFGFRNVPNMTSATKKSGSNSLQNNIQENGHVTQPTVVAVEVKPQFMESQLPPSVRRKKFGAM